MQGLMWDSEAEQGEHKARASVQQEAGAMPQPKAKKSGPSVPFVGKAASESIHGCFGIISWLCNAMYNQTASLKVVLCEVTQYMNLPSTYPAEVSSTCEYMWVIRSLQTRQSCRLNLACSQ